MYPMPRIFFWGLDRGTPNIIYDARLHVLETIGMSEHFGNGRSAKRVTGSYNLVDVKSISPHAPIDSFQASGAASNVASSPKILPGNLFPFAIVYEPQDTIGFFHFR
jgi:hypothetical protein